MVDYWYNFEDVSGGEFGAFNVYVSRKYLQEISSQIDWENLEKRVRDISFEGKRNRLEITKKEEDALLFGTIGAGSFGLDFNPRFSDGENAAYSTHNCYNPNARILLMKAFFTWASCVEALHWENNEKKK